MPYKSKSWKSILSYDTNDVIKILTISDLFVLSGFGLIAPIFAVFLTDNIQGGNIEVAGIATTIFLLTRSIGQIPAAYIVDKIKGESDDYWSLMIGSAATCLVPLLYLTAYLPWHIYIIQLVYGFAQALTYPSWLAIFTRHIDKQKEGFEWGIYSTLTDLGGAGVAMVGGIIAQSYGFKPLFILVSIMSFIGTAWLMYIKKYLTAPRQK